MVGRPSDEEALRMVVAFYCVMEPERRAELLQLAEKLASESQVVEGCTHFLLLDRDVHEQDDSERSVSKDAPTCGPDAPQT